jgi:hypothetical protein
MMMRAFLIMKNGLKIMLNMQKKFNDYGQKQVKFNKIIMMDYMILLIRKK